MKSKVLFFIFVFIIGIFFVPSVSALWYSNSTLITGITDPGIDADICAFNDSGTFKSITTGNPGIFYGFQWNESTSQWDSNSSIVTGLVDPGYDAAPDVFYDSGIWKLITGWYGYDGGGFTGYQWNTSTSQWDVNSSLVTGLGTHYKNTYPEVFIDSGTLKLISGCKDGLFYGYQWNTSTSQWDSNSSLVTGLVDVGTFSKHTVFNDSGTWKLITGRQDGLFTGYYWNGTSWISDSSLVTGLVDVGWLSAPSVYNDFGTWRLIVGNSVGTYAGYDWNNKPTISNLMTEHVTNNSQVYTNVTAPYFNWTYSDADGDTQTHWEIQVGTSSGASDKWSSGQISGADVSDIYAGSTLSGDVTYYVQVRIKDGLEWSSWTLGTFEVSIPTVPINFGSTSGNFWVNHTWDSGANTDTFNVSVNGSWTNGSANTYYNDSSLSPHEWSNITVYAYNTTSGVLSSGVSQNVQIPNNVPVISNVSASYTINEEETLNIYAEYSDADSDNCTFGDNSSEWDINITTGVISWLTVKGDVGTYSYSINVSDGYGSVSTHNFNVTIINLADFSFINSLITPSTIRENEPFTVSVDINDSDGSITTAIVKINYNNYTMTQGSGDTWSYIFTGTQVPTRYYVTNFYAQDDSGDWNSTNSTLWIDAVSSTGTGSTGGVSPTPTPTPTETPIPTKESPVEKIPINVTEKLEDVVDMFHMYTNGNYISIFHINFNKEEKIYSKQIYIDNPAYCSILNESTLINECALGNGVVTVSMPFVPEDEGLFLSTRDYVEIGGDDEVYYINVDVFIINLYSLATLKNGMLMLIILIVIVYFKKKNK